MAGVTPVKMYNDLINDFETLYNELVEATVSNANLLEYMEAMMTPLIDKINSGDAGIDPELAKEIIHKHIDMMQLLSSSNQQFSKTLLAANKMKANAEQRAKQVYPPDHPLE